MQHFQLICILDNGALLPVNYTALYEMNPSKKVTWLSYSCISPVEVSSRVIWFPSWLYVDRIWTLMDLIGETFHLFHF